MRRYNIGNIYTNSKCVGCNKCVSVCPIMGANVSVLDYSKNTIEVSQKCIECGRCVNACSHNAREYKDDTANFFEDLREGKKISLLVDPAFYIDYGDEAPLILGQLQECGVNRIYDVAYGAEISMWAHVKYLKEHTDENGYCRAFIANTCPAVVGVIENAHPDLIPLLVPVHSPFDCTAVYVRKYLKDDSDFAYLSPCVAYTQSMHAGDNGANISYNVTFSHLMEELGPFDSTDVSAEAELTTDGVGNLASYRDGFASGISWCFSPEKIVSFDDNLSDEAIRKLTNVAKHPEMHHPALLVIEGCKNSCYLGTGVKERSINVASVLSTHEEIRNRSFGLIKESPSHDYYYKAICDKFAELDSDDFIRTYKDNFRQPNMIPEDAIQDIFKSMHKESRQKQVVNCRSCGYRSCREMAVAVANGYAKIQDCIHFMNDDLRYGAYLDRVTGLANTRGFYHKMSELINSNRDKEYLVCVGNMNKLKNLNDLYGFEVGDKVIAYIAKRLSEIVGDNGVAAHMSGGVFAFCVENKPENYEYFMSLESIDCKHLGVYFPVTIRFGLYVVRDRREAFDKIVNLATYAADKATDRSKNSNILFDETMRQELANDSEITMSMHDAMENNEFVLYLQPQFDHSNGRIVGAEVLSRWITRVGNVISPVRFIPVFERNGFVKELDKHVWENSFKLISRWEKENAPIVPLSVNVSRVSLETDAIIDTIKSLSEKYPIDKSHLYFEITESAYSKNQESLIERIGKIKELGFSIAMDDFGSGYSSLNSLKDIPIDVLKLDMGFIRGGTNVERGNEIVSHMVQMGNALKLKLVAEGVETKAQADFLLGEGCNVIQGFYYAKPMPIDKFEEMIKEKNC